MIVMEALVDSLLNTANMFHASNYVNMSNRMDRQLSISDDDVDEDLFQAVERRKMKTKVKKSRKKKGGKKYRREVDSNVVAVRLGTITDKADKVLETGDPFFCTNQACGAALNSFSQIERAEQKDDADDDEIDKFWICEFCNQRNLVDLEDEEFPEVLDPKQNENGVTLDYILEPADDLHDVANDQKNEDQVELLVFCIDVSGSMCVTQEVQGEFKLKNSKKQLDSEFADLLEDGDVGFGQQNQIQPRFGVLRGRRKAPPKVSYVSRLQSVQAAVDSQLELLVKENPSKRVVLITFSNEVTIYGNGLSDPVVIAGDKLQNVAKLKSISAEYELIGSIADSYEALSSCLYGLETGGQTSLGPALIVSSALASKKPGSKVILCTDGLANVGLGSIEGVNLQDPEQLSQIDAWYEGVANEALTAGISIDVLSITGDECSLEMLGKICDITGGTVDRVNPLTLNENFKGILDKAALAVSCSVKMLLHDALVFREDALSVLEHANDEADAPQEQKEENLQNVKWKTVDVGNIFEDTEIFFEYTTASDQEERFKELESLPFQVQIRFTLLDGSKWIRVVSQHRKATDKNEVAEEDVDMDILQANVVQRGAALAQQGEYEQFRAHNRMWGGFMARNARRASQEEALEIWSENLRDADGAMGDLIQDERQQNVSLSAVSSVERRQYRQGRRGDRAANALYKAKKARSKRK